MVLIGTYFKIKTLSFFYTNSALLLYRSPVICAIYGCIDSLKITSENYSLVTKKSPAHEAILAILIRSLPGSSFQDIVNSPQNGSFLKGITPLCLSAYLGKVGICKCLLENGAAVDGVDKNGTVIFPSLKIIIFCRC